MASGGFGRLEHIDSSGGVGLSQVGERGVPSAPLTLYNSICQLYLASILLCFTETATNLTPTSVAVCLGYHPALVSNPFCLTHET